jgi:hypothetical protein
VFSEIEVAYSTEKRNFSGMELATEKEDVVNKRSTLLDAEKK